MAFCVVEGEISSEGIAGVSKPSGLKVVPEVKSIEEVGALSIETGELWM